MLSISHDHDQWLLNEISMLTPANSGAGTPETTAGNNLFQQPLTKEEMMADVNNELRLFFEKDTIDWTAPTKVALYTMINDLHHNQEALWNGSHGGWPEWLVVEDEVLAWKRAKGASEVHVAVNLSDVPRTLNLNLDSNLVVVWGGVASARSVTIPEHSATVWATPLNP